jgi:hypothetical protein
MGVQTDVVIADPDEAQALANTDDPAAARQGFTFSGFDCVKLGTLISLLKTGGPDAGLERCLHRIDVVRASSREETVVSVVPPELVAEVVAVAGLEGAEFDALAASWEATEEFAGWSRADVRELLRQLGDLAESASLRGKCLMVWQSP